jgi:hypothetical protein
MTQSTLAKITGIVCFSILILSCSFLEKVVSQGTETQKGGAGPAQTAEDPRVQKSLALRSVQMELETTFPGQAADRIQVWIDADGNQRIERTLPAPEGEDVSESPNANVLEIFVIGGSAYSRMGKEGQPESSPEQVDALHRILYNPTGPGMWLMLIPKKGFTSAGKEEKGGFQTTRYSVNGSVEEGSIRGDIWQDEGTKALIGADLSVSETLFYPPDMGKNGTVTIRLTVEKADVPSITLPG